MAVEKYADPVVWFREADLIEKLPYAIRLLPCPVVTCDTYYMAGSAGIEGKTLPQTHVGRTITI